MTRQHILHNSDKASFLVLCSLVMLWSCQPQPVHSRTVATVGPEVISVTDLAVRLVQTPGLKDADAKVKQKSAKLILESLIDDSTLLLEAKKRGIKVSDTDVDHHMRNQKALLGQTGMFRFQKESFIDDTRMREHYREQLAIAQFLRLLPKEGILICETVNEILPSQNCIKRENFLLELRKKHRIVVEESNIPVALKTLGENA